MRAFVAASLATALTACTSANGPKDEPPALEITSPARGTSADGTTVTVTGTVTDETSGVRVTVNGTDAAVGKDGAFTASVTLTDGIGIIETHAIDKGGHDVRDVRAVLAGTIGMTDGTKVSPIGAHASASALGAIGTAIAADAKAVDWTATVQSLNPVYNNGGCLGAVIDITSISLGAVDVALTPQTGKLGAKVTVNNVVVKLHASYKAACLGGSTTITVKTSAAHIQGDLGVAVTSGKLATTIANTSVGLDNFDLSVSGVPGPVVDLFNSVVRGKVEDALTHVIATKLPPIANGKLSGLLAKPFTTKVLGEDTKLTVTPTTATIAATGIYLGVDTKVLVTGGAGGMYAQQTPPAATTLMSQTRNLGLAIANDLVNQLLSGLWAAGAFDKKVPVATVSVLAALLDADATQLVVKLSLPPTVQSDGTGNLQLAIGDAIISVQDDSGTELQKLALSVQTGIAISASPAGTLSMALGTPTVYAQVLGQVDDGSRPLTDKQVEGLVTGAWGVVSLQAADALAKLPMPTVAGVKLGAPTVQAISSYLLADIPLE
jgi:hypothetical protein